MTYFRIIVALVFVLAPVVAAGLGWFDVFAAGRV